MSESPLIWSDELLLGYGPMDDIHEEFVDIVHAMQVVADEALPALLDRFAAHAEHHFSEEAAWMNSGDYPARDCHVDEHDKVMASVREVQQLVAAGDIDVARRLARALEEWFPGHATYMDSALAQWMVKRSSGGVPIVLRRKAAKVE
ncbi:bacteriohemerythrin [Parazoarcus communis]|uniref:bacteriohemerythrin n=1 Tax=Parazoarcus communis TaxID=41977 RepID=UPI001F1F846D|nr:hemerythrin domain-containing protein [Parazoarcus communis]